jgi:hypothetical protein
MAQEPQKSIKASIIIAVMALIGVIIAAIIPAVSNLMVEGRRQEAELTKIALASISTQITKTTSTSNPTIILPAEFVTMRYIGRVFDTVTHSPVPDAEISLEIPGMMPRIAYTDTTGTYFYNLALTGQTDGKLRVTANGYDIYSRNISVSPSLLSLEEIRLSPIRVVQASVAPEATAIITLEPTSIPAPTEPPVVELAGAGIDEQLKLIDNYYRCFNKPNPQDNDLLECWKMLSNYPGEIQQNLEAKGGFSEFSKYWKTKKVTYVLYICPNGGKNFVDAEYYLYQRSDLSVPIGPFFLEYTFALDDKGWRIKGAADQKQVSTYCESEPRIKNLTLQ